SGSTYRNCISAAWERELANSCARRLRGVLRSSRFRIRKPRRERIPIRRSEPVLRWSLPTGLPNCCATRYYSRKSPITVFDTRCCRSGFEVALHPAVEHRRGARARSQSDSISVLYWFGWKATIADRTSVFTECQYCERRSCYKCGYIRLPGLTTPISKAACARLSGIGVLQLGSLDRYCFGGIGRGWVERSYPVSRRTESRAV